MNHTDRTNPSYLSSKSVYNTGVFNQISFYVFFLVVVLVCFLETITYPGMFLHRTGISLSILTLVTGLLFFLNYFRLIFSQFTFKKINTLVVSSLLIISLTLILTLIETLNYPNFVFSRFHLNYQALQTLSIFLLLFLLLTFVTSFKLTISKFSKNHSKIIPLTFPWLKQIIKTLSKNMKKNFDLIMKKEVFNGIKILDLCFLSFICLISLWVRISFLNYKSSDMSGSLIPWMNSIVEHGRIRSLSEHISGYDYTSPYMYILIFLSYLPIITVHAIKFVSIFFDYFVGILVFLITRLILHDGKKAMLGFVMVILLPTLVMNGSVWGQCDIIYCTFSLLSLLFILKDKDFKSLLFFSIAFSIKLQAIFFLPILVILWLKNKIKVGFFLLVPLVYFIFCIPAWIMGSKLGDLLSVYFGQAFGRYPELALNYPNIYYLLNISGGGGYLQFLGYFGIAISICIIGFFAYFLYDSNVIITKKFIIELTLFIVMILVYFLPHMHERYGLFADLVAVIYGIMNLKKIYVPIALQIISVIPYLATFGIYSVPLNILAFLYLILIVTVGYDFTKSTYKLIGKESKI